MMRSCVQLGSRLAGSETRIDFVLRPQGFDACDGGHITESAPPLFVGSAQSRVYVKITPDSSRYAEAAPSVERRTDVPDIYAEERQTPLPNGLIYSVAKSLGAGPTNQ
jgi:hypothetical protein